MDFGRRVIGADAIKRRCRPDSQELSLVADLSIIILRWGPIVQRPFLSSIISREKQRLCRSNLHLPVFGPRLRTRRAGAIRIVEEHPPDIVLIEASLSDIDSVEMVAFIRSDLRACRMPILAMSVLPHMKADVSKAVATTSSENLCASRSILETLT